MAFESLENIITLLCTIVGLLYCVFNYIENPKRGYRLIIVFFLANFLSEYYWTIYQLVMHTYPNVSEFAAYFGWNVGFLFLLVTVFILRSKGAKRYYNPVILIPILINIPQFKLYLKYGGILNNLWQVVTTTLTAIFCLQEILYYFRCKRKKRHVQLPLFYIMVLFYLIAQYGMWTASCFDWESELHNPYMYCSVLGSILSIFFAYGLRRYYEMESPAEEPQNVSELRFQVLVQSVVSIVIIGICVAGFFVVHMIKKSMTGVDGVVQNEGRIVVYLFIISSILILLVLIMIYALTSRYRKILINRRKMKEWNRSRLNFIITIVVTLALMLFAVIYNNTVLYKSSVISVNEETEEAVKMNSTELENYLTVASTTLRVAADTVALMEKNGNSAKEIEKYITDQTTIQSEQFDENFTGIYAYIDGQYLDGLGWVPPEGYEPTERDWYKAAVEKKGEVVIVSPYVDAQTGSVVITICECISSEAEGGDGSSNVVCLDVIVNHIQEVTKAVEIAGKGYGLVVNSDGFIIAHQKDENNGADFKGIYGQGLLDKIKKTKSGKITATIEGEECTLFVSPVMDQWYMVIVISNTELLEETYSQLAVNVMVSIITFCLIAFFYYIGYMNEQLSGRKVEEMNIQMVTALATAIDAKDKYTNGHSSRVAEYTRMIAARAGYSKDDQDEIYMMGLLHDVGKIGVPDSVINKPAKLTDEEFELIKKHPVIGSEILESIKENPKLAMGARWHHERYGGGGYPDGISGEDIPEEARIIAVADAYDAMTSRRSYRDVMPQDKVRSEIKDGMGTQFDPEFAEIMLQMIDEDKDYKMREQT